MPLDPWAKRFLDMAGASGVADISRLTAVEMRNAFRGLALAVGARNIPISSVEKGELPGPSGMLPVRVYTPAGRDAEVEPTGILPGLLYLHGGGCVFGDLDTHDGICRMLANEARCRVFALDYRLAPEHAFPAAIDDCHAAALWISANAARLGIDPDRLAIGGDSAGGNLSAVVCQRAKSSGPHFKLNVLFCPVLDMSASTPSRRALSAGYFLDQAMIDWSLRLYCPNGALSDDPEISPLRARDFSGLPETHVHTAEFDPLRDEGDAYAQRMRDAGVAVQHAPFAGMIHGFFAMTLALPPAKQAVEDVSAALRGALFA
jgi:acetyl esterase/lipase